jgi:hypothetical protein
MSAPVKCRRIVVPAQGRQPEVKLEGNMAQADGGGFLSRWTLKTGGVIAPDERLPWGQTVVL